MCMQPVHAHMCMQPGACIHVCTARCMHTCMQPGACIHVCSQVHAYMYAARCMHTCVYSQVHAYMWCMHTCVCSQVHAYMYAARCMHTCVYSQVHAYMCMQPGACIHVYAARCMHTCVCSQVHAYMCMQPGACIHVYMTVVFIDIYVVWMRYVSLGCSCNYYCLLHKCYAGRVIMSSVVMCMLGSLIALPILIGLAPILKWRMSRTH